VDPIFREYLGVQRHDVIFSYLFSELLYFSIHVGFFTCETLDKLTEFVSGAFQENPHPGIPVLHVMSHGLLCRRANRGRAIGNGGGGRVLPRIAEVGAFFQLN
jgi:hypothetical protein